MLIRKPGGQALDLFFWSMQKKQLRKRVTDQFTLTLLYLRSIFTYIMDIPFSSGALPVLVAASS
ncbi:hypothetical protein APZ00_18305 [Pannonibacter phragmitetus]|uniref:Uncharacterized protein n=1 Tax=Pannonibacter phragmitetus TaxID=121719 RepID=A0A0U3PNB6_9HYPH|nr:hypothetical protein APZ00_18305 [Pannonibacter phragmitetus]